MSDNLTNEIKKSVVENLGELLKTGYVKRGLGREMATFIQAQFSEGSYDRNVKASGFAESLTNDMRKCSHDLHLHLIYNPAEAEDIEKKALEDPHGERYEDDWWSLVRCDNFGIPKVEYLQGNIGYVKIIYFAPTSLAGSLVVSVMQFLSRADALIFDLRDCRGGDPFTVQLFESYLYSKNKKPKLLHTKHSPNELDSEIQQIWTMPYIPGIRLPETPVYILTSNETFSGGEDMAYTLKHHNRATIIGEKTKGGAHPIEELSVGHGFVLIMPNAYPEHPVTKSNWEGKGVTPHIEIQQEQALGCAHQHILEKLRESASTSLQEHELNWHLQKIKSIYQPINVSEEILKRYIGQYRGWVVSYADGQIYLSPPGGFGRTKMTPISESMFTADMDYNVRFELGEDGNANALIWLAKSSEAEIKYERYQ
jgi:hypothetical protein